MNGVHHSTALSQVPGDDAVFAFNPAATGVNAMTIQELKALRKDHHDKAGAILKKVDDETRSATEAEVTEFDGHMAKVGEIDADIQRREKFEGYISKINEIGQRKSDAGQPGATPPKDERVFSRPTNEQRDMALTAWCRNQYGLNISDEEREAAKVCSVNIEARDLEVKLPSTAELRGTNSQSVGTSTLGGYSVPTGFVNNLEQAMAFYGPMRQVAEIIRTEGGGSLPWPTANDAGVAGVLVAEAATYATSDVTFGQTTLSAYKYSSGLIKVSAELLQDSAFDLPQILGEMMGERIGRITNTHFTTGDASSKPSGIVTGSTLGKTAASATAITFDELLDLANSVDPVYRPQSAFMMHTNIWNYIRKLKDGASRYLLQESNLAAGIPAALLGYPVYLNSDMQSSVATGTKTVLFGVMNKYKIRDVASVRIRRLVELYAGTDQEGFVAFSRHDGALLNAGGNPVKHLIQA